MITRFKRFLRPKSNNGKSQITPLLPPKETAGAVAKIEKSLAIMEEPVYPVF